MKTFAEQFAEFDSRREQAEITSAAVAREAGMSRAQISHYRSGRKNPTVDVWIRLNRTLEAMIKERAEKLRKLAR